MDINPASSLLCKSLPVGVDADIKFAEPWEARVFAIIVALAQDDHFTWSEWVERFSKEVAAQTAIEASGGTPLTYYEQWLRAAEKLLVTKGVTTQEQLIAKRFAAGAVSSNHVIR
jgi:nitrile hydratase accessory protein